MFLERFVLPKSLPQIRHQVSEDYLYILIFNIFDRHRIWDATRTSERDFSHSLSLSLSFFFRFKGDRRHSTVFLFIAISVPIMCVISNHRISQSETPSPYLLLHIFPHMLYKYSLGRSHDSRNMGRRHVFCVARHVPPEFVHKIDRFRHPYMQ